MEGVGGGSRWREKGEELGGEEGMEDRRDGAVCVINFSFTRRET